MGTEYRQDLENPVRYVDRRCIRTNADAGGGLALNALFWRLSIPLLPACTCVAPPLLEYNRWYRSPIRALASSAWSPKYICITSTSTSSSTSSTREAYIRSQLCCSRYPSASSCIAYVHQGTSIQHQLHTALYLKGAAFDDVSLQDCATGIAVKQHEHGYSAPV
jgi:hypothetical protein